MGKQLAEGLVIALVVAGLRTSAANARAYGWEFNVDPDDPSNEMPMTRIRNGYGLGGGPGLFVDDGEGADGFVIGGWTGAFAMDIRVQVLERCGRRSQVALLQGARRRRSG